MHNASKKYLLQIEPKRKKSKKPVNDQLTGKMIRLLRHAKKGRHYKGTHKCICGERSDNCDFFINGYTTNSLAVHYLKWHRGEVPIEEIEKLENI